MNTEERQEIARMLAEKNQLRADLAAAEEARNKAVREAERLRGGLLMAEQWLIGYEGVKKARGSNFATDIENVLAEIRAALDADEGMTNE